MSEPERQIVVVGDGAVGFALTALWREQERFEVVLFGRSGASKKKRRVDLFGKTVVGIEQSDVALHASVWVFVTKAYDLEEAVKHVRPLMSDDALLVSLCNGYVGDVFRRAVAGISVERLRIGVTNFGARFDAEDQLHVSNEAGVALWGPLDRGVAKTDLEAEFEGCLLGVRWQADPWPAIRFKWLANVVINGLCAKHGLATNGELLQRVDEVRTVLAEAYRLGAELWGAWPEPLSHYDTQIFALIKATAGNENSMARDTRLGRKTEAEYLYGFVAGRSDYPALSALYRSFS